MNTEQSEEQPEQKEQCPNKCGPLETFYTHKDVCAFNGSKEIHIGRLCIEACAECGYTGHVYLS